MQLDDTSRLRASANDTAIATENSEFWMRAVSFAGLHRVLHLVASHPKGITSAEMDSAIKQQAIYLTQAGGVPSRSTLYHVRNILLRLGLLKQVSGKAKLVQINEFTHYTSLLLSEPPQPINDSKIADSLVKTFASVVLSNSSCRKWFFDLFAPKHTHYDLKYFQQCSRSVSWRRMPDGIIGVKGDKIYPVSIHANDGREIILDTPSSVNSIIFGVRYWATVELNLLDEVYRGSRGMVSYPLLNINDAEALNFTIRGIIGAIRANEEWTTLSILDLAEQLCEANRIQRATLDRAISTLYLLFPGHIVLIPTARSFPTMTAYGKQEHLWLTGYYREKAGRIISHIRLHKSLGDIPNDSRFTATGFDIQSV